MVEVDLRSRHRGLGEEGLQIAMHPFPQIGYVIQDVSASSFGEETVICGNDDSPVEEGEIKVPVCEEEGEERGPGDLHSLSK